MNTDKLREDIIFEDNIRGFDIAIHSSWGLFSPKEVDSGTRLLMDCLEINESDVCLDMGCGYGVIGVVMAKLAPNGKVYMIDRDFVAVDYARKNAEFNHIRSYEAFLSNAFSHIPDGLQFDVIASNLPAHVKKEVLYLMLSDAKKHLKIGGKLYVVTMARLRDFIKRNFTEIFGNYDKVNKVKQSREHAVHLGIRES